MRFKAVAAGLAVLWAGCHRSPEGGYRRVAFPVFENLTGDNSLEWWGGVTAELAAAAATGSPRCHPLRVESWWDAPAARATHVLHGYLVRRGPRLRLEATLEELRRGRVERSVVVEESAAAGPAVLADRLVGELGLRSRRVAHYQPEAVRVYAEAYRAGDPAAMLEKAVAVDANFGPAYLQLVRLRWARGDRAGAEAALEAARRAALDPIERSRLDLTAAGLMGDAAAYGRALEAMARLTPADPEVFQALAGRRLASRDYTRAAQDYREALARDPDNPVLLNQAGYTLAYSGEFREAVVVLLRYRQLQPAEPNPADSLGDIYFQMGNFAEASTYYLESVEKSPEFAGGGSLYKAAWARWWQGDRAGADQLVTRYFQQREAGRDPLLELRRAQWEYLTGRSGQAIERLRALSAGAGSGELRALAAGFLAAWSLEGGRREQARRYAEAAAGASVQARDLARLCVFLAQTENSPEEWMRRAREVFPRPEQEGLRETALAYGFLLSGHYRQAVSVLRGLWAKSPPSPAETLPVLLAWAAAEGGEDPGPWLRRWPVPDPRLPQPFDFLSWPRIAYLQAMYEEAQGRTEQARVLYRVFVQALGDRPGHDRERNRARAKAGG